MIDDLEDTIKRGAAEALAIPQRVCRTRGCRRNQCCFGMDRGGNEFQCILNLTPEQRGIFDMLLAELRIAFKCTLTWFEHSLTLPDEKRFLYPLVAEIIRAHSNAKDRRMISRLEGRFDQTKLAARHSPRLSSAQQISGKTACLDSTQQPSLRAF